MVSNYKYLFKKGSNRVASPTLDTKFTDHVSHTQLIHSTKARVVSAAPKLYVGLVAEDQIHSLS